MQCPQCGSQNEQGRKSCAVCGASLEPQARSEYTPEHTPLGESEPIGIPYDEDVSRYVTSPNAIASGKVSKAMMFLAVGIALLVIIGTIVVVIISSS